MVKHVISALKTKLGLTKHSIKTAGAKRMMNEWVLKMEKDPFKKLQQSVFKRSSKT